MNPFQGYTNEEVLEVMSYQEEFDLDLARWAIYQIFVENKTPRSAQSGGIYAACKYGAEINGIGCAIAAITPESLQECLEEGNGISRLMEMHPSLAEYFGKENKDFLAYIQNIHDVVLELDVEMAGRFFLGHHTSEDIQFVDNLKLHYECDFFMLPPIKEWGEEEVIDSYSSLYLPMYLEDEESGISGGAKWLLYTICALILIGLVFVFYQMWGLLITPQ